VVAERDRVGAGGEDLLRQLRRQAYAVRSVLSIDNADVDVELVSEARQTLLEDAAARMPDDVGDEEEDQGTLRDAAE
jgi:hypothetical protein